MTYLITLGFAAILLALFSALLRLLKNGASAQVVQALKWRVILSIALFATLLLLKALHLI